MPPLKEVKLFKIISKRLSWLEVQMKSSLDENRSHVDVDGRFDDISDADRTFAKNPHSFNSLVSVQPDRKQSSSLDFLGGFIHTCHIVGIWNIMNMISATNVRECLQ